MGDTKEASTNVSTDILLIVYAGEPDAEWEKRLQLKCPVPGQLKVRWADPRRPDGTWKLPSQFHSTVFEDVTVVFTYQPVPDRKCRC